MTKRGLGDVDVRDTKVLVRVDFNVPIEQGMEGLAKYTHRLKATLPTIDYLRHRGAGIIICSHLGRPNGKVVEGLRMGPVGDQLSLLLGTKVTCLNECVGPAVEAAVSKMSNGDVLMLENLRFNPGEEANCPEFSRSLARLAEIYVMDAFAVAHRAHASMVGVPELLPSCAGLLVQQEVQILGKALENPDRPLAALLGGAKVGYKIKVLNNLLNKVDRLYIGGGMANAFLQAQGHSTGASEVNPDDVELANQILNRANQHNIPVNLPTDVVVADRFGGEAGVVRTVAVDGIPPSWHVMDIGQATADAFCQGLGNCGTVIWNGPMGVFEFPAFSEGTKSIAYDLSASTGATIVGGGSTAEVVEELGLTAKMDHVSTGGGASLEFLEGKDLPGLAVLPDV